MEEVQIKYINNTLTTSGLDELREIADKMSDADIEQLMLDDWMHGDSETVCSPSKLNLIKKKIDAKKDKGKGGVALRVFVIAASILLPVLSIALVYLFTENKQLISDNIIIATDRGEYVNIALPDGTKVAINSESALEYFPLTYNKKDRNIKFKGEAYFDVVKNAEVPFNIAIKMLDIKVLGTKFNLLARENEENIEIFLQEGHLMLVSHLNNEQFELQTPKKVIYNKSTGNFTVVEEDTIEDAVAWKRKELVFNGVKLNEVLITLSRAYNTTFRIEECDQIGADLFSGTLPADNLQETMDILLKSYNFKSVTINDNLVVFSCN